MAESKAGKGVAPVIIVKKIIKRGHGGHHGGAWKIAYADFVTAMMAFFLLMWLLSYTDPGTRNGIADYFNRPLSALLTAGPGAATTTAPKSESEKKAEQQKQDAKTLEKLKAQLNTVIDKNPKLRAFKNQIKIDITSEGLRIQIVDQKNRPMFDVGLAVLKDYTKTILHDIGKTLNSVGNPISIAGHTDSLQYSGGDAGYSNWELSSDRANAARRELISGGMSDKKVLQVRGLAGSVPLDRAHLADAANRRISIVVLNNETVERLMRDGETVDVGGEKPLVLPGGDAPSSAPRSPLPPGATTTSAAAAAAPTAQSSATAPAGQSSATAAPTPQASATAAPTAAATAAPHK